jgi:hypothetical protein
MKSQDAGARTVGYLLTPSQSGELTWPAGGTVTVLSEFRHVDDESTSLDVAIFRGGIDHICLPGMHFIGERFTSDGCR